MEPAEANCCVKVDRDVQLEENCKVVALIRIGGVLVNGLVQELSVCLPLARTVIPACLHCWVTLPLRTLQAQGEEQQEPQALRTAWTAAPMSRAVDSLRPSRCGQRRRTRAHAGAPDMRTRAHAHAHTHTRRPHARTAYTLRGTRRQRRQHARGARTREAAARCRTCAACRPAMLPETPTGGRLCSTRPPPARASTLPRARRQGWLTPRECSQSRPLQALRPRRPRAPLEPPARRGSRSRPSEACWVQTRTQCGAAAAARGACAAGGLRALAGWRPPGRPCEPCAAQAPPRRPRTRGSTATVGARQGARFQRGSGKRSCVCVCAGGFECAGRVLVSGRGRRAPGAWDGRGWVQN